MDTSHVSGYVSNSTFNSLQEVFILSHFTPYHTYVCYCFNIGLSRKMVSGLTYATHVIRKTLSVVSKLAICRERSFISVLFKLCIALEHIT